MAACLVPFGCEHIVFLHIHVARLGLCQRAMTTRACRTWPTKGGLDEPVANNMNTLLVATNCNRTMTEDALALSVEVHWTTIGGEQGHGPMA